MNFRALTTTPSPVTHPVMGTVTVSTTWHSNDDDVYRAPPIDRSILPTAPRAAREPNIDRSRLPKSPPYTAFLGNLPYDVTEESIKDFFRGLNVSNASEPGFCWGNVGFKYHDFGCLCWFQLLDAGFGVNSLIFS
ncbi:hypothetical protein llap_22460 [Limosa lapponica baueri]|uniref:RRM domain-containing protein n=1 Tax=Limosa lapponica baueri TaxID=1758121 RepID=A0A2I0T0C8_LIMLA|nr:hypothetical protein llap_22460 [Limosa lapponica baueri]